MADGGWLVIYARLGSALRGKRLVVADSALSEESLHSCPRKPLEVYSLHSPSFYRASLIITGRDTKPPQTPFDRDDIELVKMLSIRPE